MRLLLACTALALVPLTATPAPAQTQAQAQPSRGVAFAAAMPNSGTLVLPLASEADLAARAPGLDAATRAAIVRALQSQQFDYEEGSVARLPGVGAYRSVVILGTGGDALDAPALHVLGATAAKETAGIEGPVALATTGLAPGAAAELALGARLGGYDYDETKGKEARAAAKPSAPITVIGAGGEAWDRRNLALADGVAFARDLIAEPSNTLYPESFVERTRAAFAGARGVTIEVLDEKQMAAQNMGAILSVGVGSVRPPRMLVVHYRGAGGQPIVLAGKGITFDSGGISIKGASGMWRMKGDMAGAAAVVGTVHALAKSGAPVNVVAIAALAENMPSGSATRPGDIVTAYNGKTIEVLNTDAEGRMVLADAVAYADAKFRPAAIVDVATLTGAKVSAIGNDYAALFSTNDALADQLEASADATGEPLWRLPLERKHAKKLKSTFADYANVSDSSALPGATYGAAFIAAFAGESTPFAHLDIAGMQFGVTSPLTPNGVDAFGVRLLENFVRNYRPVPAEAK